jgi:hypothetical protein
MTAALLDRTVARILACNRITVAPPQQRVNLAAIIHQAETVPVIPIRAPGLPIREAASDAATTTPAATWHRSTR